MTWVSQHLNWAYGIALIIGSIILGIVAFGYDNGIGYLVYILITILGGELVLWRKNRLFAYPILVLFPVVFAIVVLCVSTKQIEGDKVNA